VAGTDRLGWMSSPRLLAEPRNQFGGHAVKKTS